MKPLKHKPLSKKIVNDILRSNPSAVQTQTPVLLFSNQRDTAPITLSRESNFDSLCPEEKIRDFLTFARAVVSRYEDDERLQSDSEAQTQDLLHYMELSDNMNAAEGFGMYKKLTDVRRIRRDCKNEIDLLKPVYDFLVSGDLIKQLEQLQGKCRIGKQTISGRQYTLRTDVMK